MRASAAYWLAAFLFVTGLGLVHARHEHRLAYAELLDLELQNDALVDEWAQLLTEENVWAFPHRIEKDAKQNLAMKSPDAGEVVYIDLASPPQSESEFVLQEAQ